MQTLMTPLNEHKTIEHQCVTYLSVCPRRRAGHRPAMTNKLPTVGVIYPKDYTLVLSRILVIPKAAKHPNAAKLFVDYALSKRGQEIMANQAQLYSIRPDVQGETTAANLTKMLGASLKPIGVSADLLVYLDPAKRLAFLKQWQQAIGSR